MATQSFGDYAAWHPHLRALVADGLFLLSRERLFLCDGTGGFIASMAAKCQDEFMVTIMAFYTGR